jgi:hypothetical protein
MTKPRPLPEGAASSDRPRFGFPGGPGQHTRRLGPTGAAAGLLAAGVLVGGLVWSAATGQAPPSEKPQIFGGSLVLDDYRPLTVIDLATGSVTVRLEGVYAQVGASNYSDVEAVQTTAGTMLVNRVTGEFNMLGKDDYVLGPAVGGVSLGPLAGETGAAGFAAGPLTYIVRYAPQSTVSLVGAATAEAAAEAVATRSHRPVRPLGFARLPGRADEGPGGAAVAGGALWVLEAKAGAGGGKCTLERLRPSPAAPLGLAAVAVSTLPIPCSRAALESTGSALALAVPGAVEFFHQKGRPLVATTATTKAMRRFLPVNGAAGRAYFLLAGPRGWSLLDASPEGELTGPFPLSAFGPGSEPVPPAYSRGLLYSLDQAQPGQPTLWTINPEEGAMKPVRGAPTYPAKSVTEKASFAGAEVLVDGPRVVFNNPDSLLAVVVFTDGSHPPVIVDKSDAIVVSAAGPGDVNVKALRPKHKQPHNEAHQRGRARHTGPPTTAPVTTTVPTTLPPPPQPVVPAAAQAAGQQVNCATTTEKPYQPQVTSVDPSDQSALVSWSYHLLDEQDCLPSTWSVTLATLGGGPEPAQPVQFVNGQQQLLVTGLYPGTTYRGFVTAYIGKQSTPSAPFSFRTTAVGPGAPASVTEAADGRGGWLVSWVPCRRGQGCLVPAVKWTVVGTSCGPGYVAHPPVISVPGGSTSISVNDGDSLGLLGDSLQFSVEGLSSAGLIGAPTQAKRCSQAWEAPNAADLAVAAAGVPSGQTVTAQISVAILHGVSPVLALGGDKVSFTYNVAGHTVGPTLSPRASVPGLSPTRLYQATVTVTPAGQPQAAVTLTSPQFSKSLPWPAGLSLLVSGSAGPDANAGTALATFHALPAGQFLAEGKITCASVAVPVSGPVVGSQFVAGVNLDEMGGACTMSLTLTSTQSPDPYGVPSPLLSAQFTIGALPHYSFSAQAAEPCTANCKTLNLYVSFSGPGQPAGTDWEVKATAPGPGCSKSTRSMAVANFPVTLSWPLRCPVPVISVSWVYLGKPARTFASLVGLPTTSTAPSSSSTTSTAISTSSSTSTSAPGSTSTSASGSTSTVPTSAPPSSATTVVHKTTTTTVPAVTIPPSTTMPSTSTTLATTTSSVPTTTPTTAPTTAPSTTTCPSTGCPSTTTTTTPTTTSSSTTVPASTTTASTTTTTGATSTTTATTATTTSTTSPSTTTTAPTSPQATQVAALAAQVRGAGPGGPGSAAFAVGWACLAGMLVASLVGAAAWPLRRRAKARRRLVPSREARS